MEAAAPAKIGRLQWRVWPGKEWGRARGLPTTGLWPRMGGGAPAAGRPAARREHGRDGSAPADPRSGKKHGRHREVVGTVWSCEEVVDCGKTGQRRGRLGGAHRQDRQHVLRRARC
jgi:hypothetical protein